MSCSNVMDTFWILMFVSILVQWLFPLYAMCRVSLTLEQLKACNLGSFPSPQYSELFAAVHVVMMSNIVVTIAIFMLISF